MALQAQGLSRADLIVTANLWPGNPAWDHAPKTGAQTNEECDASLSRLGLDYIDLYLIHAPDGGGKRLEQWRALLDLQASGKARSVGVSNFNETHIDEIAAAGLPMPNANQIELHPWPRKPGLLAHMMRHGIAPIAYSSLVRFLLVTRSLLRTGAKPKRRYQTVKLSKAWRRSTAYPTHGFCCDAR